MNLVPISEVVNLEKNVEEKIDYADLSDDDLQKFVSVGQPFKNLSYEPPDLVPLVSTKSLTIQGTRSLRQEASEQLSQLSLAFYEVFKKPLVVMSAYRSYMYQKNQIAENCKQSGYCAREGESEHQLGLVVDLWEASNEEKFLAKYQAEYDWLVENAWNWGFHQSYQKGKLVDGYAVEPRHWRYLGSKLAKELWEKGMTFSEFISAS
jgi:D-alanyl-D-alanine carboxypeptidase